MVLCKAHGNHKTKNLQQIKKINRKESKHTATKNHQITNEEEEKEQRNYKICRKQVTKWQQVNAHQ